jgi:hypothetical protein
MGFSVARIGMEAGPSPQGLREELVDAGVASRTIFPLLSTTHIWHAMALPRA